MSRGWRSLAAVGALFSALSSAACSSSNPESSPDSGAQPAGADGGLSESGLNVGQTDASEQGGDASGDTGTGYAARCASLLPDASTYVPNPDGDQCIHAAPAGCFNAYAGLWRCEPTNNGNVWLINTNGYTYGANNNGQVGEGCTDCSGSFTTMSNGQGWVNVGTFTIRDGGTTAALDWNFCSGNTLQDLQTCTQSGTTYSQHSNCTLAAACPGQ